ncbi:hypothetical protein [Kitasatospora sp. NPDC090308]|uniref:hypothetical protein n=1 Tax=Kitasatospora sp. NPDC090308 TaxID=3364082 RepID=UPI0037F91A13
MQRPSRRRGGRAEPGQAVRHPARSAPLLRLPLPIQLAYQQRATLTDHQPQPRVRALFDPAGHPFRLCHDLS